ncbi:MAG: leucine-rich repeat domain-containing protein [Ruminococcus sp.]|nr:leucine-rich repeat domain-containing protein [Ruminococcus sp.]
MKKILFNGKRIILSALVTVLLLGGIVPVRGKCADEGKFLYTAVNGRVIITGFDGEPEFLEIPQVIDNCPVTETANGAFYGCRSLKRVVLPPTMRKIGDSSFYACGSLKEAILPASLEKLGCSAFCGCTELEHIIIPDIVREIPESCFRACTALTEVNVPSGIKHIGNYAFSGCTSLERVTLGDGLSTIGERAFFMCGRLDNICLPSSLTELSTESLGFVPSNDGASPMAGFTVSGKKGSEAQRYAEENGIKFRPNTDIIRHSSAYHPSKKSGIISELCVITAFLLFLTIAAAAIPKKAKHQNH